MINTISIITPSYNQGNFIERTLESVLSQSIPHLQYIVIDGDSADNTLSLLKKYENKIYWISEKDTGQANAVNKGFQKATGDIIGWLNSDDIYFSETLKTVLDFFHTHPDIDVLYGDALHIDLHDKILNKYPTQKWSIKKLMQRCYISQPAVFFRRNVFNKYGFLDENLDYCMDYEFWLRLATCGAKFYYLQKILAATRLHDNAKTIAQSLNAHIEQIAMIRRYQKNIPLRMMLSYAYALIRHHWIRLI